jgi:hypothetical protein
MANGVGGAAGAAQTAANNGDLTFQQQLDAQKEIHKQNMKEQFEQTMFQDKKNKDNEALKAISDAIKDAHTNRMSQIQNIKSS